MTQPRSLESISIVLVKTSHPGNVGSVARAMKTMGLSDLRLVAPKSDEILRHDEAIALSSGSADVLEAARVFSSLPDALFDVQRSYALSARIRELGPVLQSPAQAASEVFEADLAGVPRVAFVFGAERTGLSNEDLLWCNRQVYIPSNALYSSLNLAQAVQIVCYALRVEFELLLGQEPRALGPSLEGKAQPPIVLANAKVVHDLHQHCLRAMASVDFLNPDKSKKLVARLARLFAKIPFEQEEVDLLRGFLADVERVASGRLYAHEKVNSSPSNSQSGLDG